VEVTVAAGVGAQNLGDIARDGGFFGKDGDGGAQTTSVVARRTRLLLRVDVVR